MARGINRKNIKWDIRAFEDLRRSPGIADRIGEEVDKILGKVGDGYAGGVGEGRTRSRGYVVTTSYESILDNAQNYTLLRALGGGDWGVYTTKSGKTRIASRRQAEVWGGKFEAW